MTINDLDESKVVSTPKEVKTPEALSGPVSLELEIETIADSLGVESDNSNYVDELRWLMDFAKEYEALVKKGFQIVAYPEWKKRDDGSYSTFLQLVVGQTPKQS